MRNKLLVSFILFFTLTPLTVSAEMFLFMRADCHHCANLESDLQEAGAYSNFEITPYDISKSEDNMLLYLTKAKETGYKNGGVPLLVDGEEAIEGRGPILSYLELNEQEPAASTSLSSEDNALLNEIIKESAGSEDSIFKKWTLAISISFLLILGFYGLRRKTPRK
jgi:hypothetical protein